LQQSWREAAGKSRALLPAATQLLLRKSASATFSNEEVRIAA
jgi:hypothetical protein